MYAPYLQMTGIRKHFPGVTALKGVALEAFAGEALAVIGANGAGKSTLMNVLGGVIVPDEGEIRIEGNLAVIRTPADAANHGIAFVHQELALMPTLSVIDNMLMSDFPRQGGFIDYSRGQIQCKEALARLGCDFDIKAQIRDIGQGDRQIIEIARALRGNSKIIIFDEPTSSLTAREKDRLFEVIGSLKSQGATIIYITHLLDEIFSMCERALILRNGEKVESAMIKHLTRDKVVEKMIGEQEVVRYFQRQERTPGPILLTVEDLGRKGLADRVSFTLHKGEVVGIWGLLGSGRSELFRILIGLDPASGGSIHYYKDGRKLPLKAKNAGRLMGLVTEDRRTDGLILQMSVRSNIALASLRRLMSRLWPFMSLRREEDAARYYIEKLGIKCRSAEQRLATLSGGNQQKVVVARWLLTRPVVFLLDEPTRGLDVEAKGELHAIINDLARDGAAVLLVSSDLDEITALADRFLVMDRGRIVKELPGDASRHELLAAASGIAGTTGGCK